MVVFWFWLFQLMESTVLRWGLHLLSRRRGRHMVYSRHQFYKIRRNHQIYGTKASSIDSPRSRGSMETASAPKAQI